MALTGFERAWWTTHWWFPRHCLIPKFCLTDDSKQTGNQQLNSCPASTTTMKNPILWKKNSAVLDLGNRGSCCTVPARFNVFGMFTQLLPR